MILLTILQRKGLSATADRRRQKTGQQGRKWLGAKGVAKSPGWLEDILGMVIPKPFERGS